MHPRPMARRSFRVATLAVMALLAVAGSDARADEGAVGAGALELEGSGGSAASGGVTAASDVLSSWAAP